MSTIADFHSHILPGIDDGSDCVETSVKMLEMAEAQGVYYVFATPHFYAGRSSLEQFLHDRSDAEGRLRDVLAERRDLPQVSVGAEVYYFQGMSDSEALRELTLGNSQYILIEMPFTTWTDKMYRELEDIYSKQGLVPVVAHVERYFSALSMHRIPERLAQLPVLVQSNAESFLRKQTAGRALRLLEQGKIHLLGSDCHNLTSRKPNLGEAAAVIEKNLGPAALERIHSNESKVISYFSFLL